MNSRRLFIPEAEAVERLVDLIKEHHKWVEPDAMPEKIFNGLAAKVTNWR
jgi:hypothetical protein